MIKKSIIIYSGKFFSFTKITNTDVFLTSVKTLMTNKSNSLYVNHKGLFIGSDNNYKGITLTHTNHNSHLLDKSYLAPIFNVKNNDLLYNRTPIKIELYQNVSDLLLLNTLKTGYINVYNNEFSMSINNKKYVNSTVYLLENTTKQHFLTMYPHLKTIQMKSTSIEFIVNNILQNKISTELLNALNTNYQNIYDHNTIDNLKNINKLEIKEIFNI